MAEGKELVMVFEPLCGGHRREFLSHLFTRIRQANGDHRRYVFVLATPPDNTPGLANVEFDFLPQEVRSRLETAKDGSWGSFSFWKVLKAALDKWKPDQLVLMDLTYLELALCFQRLPCATTGILFVQYPELRNVSLKTHRTHAKFRWKEAKTRLLLANRNLRRILLLNGETACLYLNRRFRTSRFVAVPDPVPGTVADPDFDLRAEYGIPADQKVFLYFGSISPRKGVGQLLEALGRLPNRILHRAAFVFCGKAEQGFEENYHAMLEGMQRHHPEIALYVHGGFVPGGRMKAMFEQADWILMPYTRPEYSSGVLAHAAAARTPVLGSCDGLLGRQISEYELGLTVLVEPGALAGAIADAVGTDFSFSEDKRRAFVEASNPALFAGKVLGF